MKYVNLKIFIFYIILPTWSKLKYIGQQKGESMDISFKQLKPGKSVIILRKNEYFQMKYSKGLMRKVGVTKLKVKKTCSPLLGAQKECLA